MDGYAYVACSGNGCQQFGEIKKESSDHDGAVVKLNAKTGEVVWVADAPGALGMAVNSDGEVYLQVMGSSETFGDVSYANRPVVERGPSSDDERGRGRAGQRQ